MKKLYMVGVLHIFFGTVVHGASFEEMWKRGVVEVIKAEGWGDAVFTVFCIDRNGSTSHALTQPKRGLPEAIAVKSILRKRGVQPELCTGFYVQEPRESTVAINVILQGPKNSDDASALTKN